jgi:hypothetical protein
VFAIEKFLENEIAYGEPVGEMEVQQRIVKVLHSQV